MIWLIELFCRGTNPITPFDITMSNDELSGPEVYTYSFETDICNILKILLYSTIVKILVETADIRIDYR